MTALEPPSKTPIRAITLLAISSFANQAMVRVTDSLLPQIAADFSVTVGAAAIVVTSYAVMHGTTQLVIGPIGDKFGAPNRRGAAAGRARWSAPPGHRGRPLGRPGAGIQPVDHRDRPGRCPRGHRG
jgi:MFS family permease